MSQNAIFLTVLALGVVMLVMLGPIRVVWQYQRGVHVLKAARTHERAAEAEQRGLLKRGLMLPEKLRREK